MIFKNKRLYLSTILDLYDRKVVAYKISKFNNNQVKIIDFEPNWVGAGCIDCKTREYIIKEYISLVGNVLTNYNLSNERIDEELFLSHYAADGFDDAKSLIKTLEKEIKKL